MCMHDQTQFLISLLPYCVNIRQLFTKIVESVETFSNLRSLSLGQLSWISTHSPDMTNVRPIWYTSVSVDRMNFFLPVECLEWSHSLVSDSSTCDSMIDHVHAPASFVTITLVEVSVAPDVTYFCVSVKMA